ncbi:Na(+)-translocating NADH-quinone reductase subunit A [bacterium]|nr:Na(+)-translocating NADH-quinone reductase subunit A [bacterium]
MQTIRIKKGLNLPIIGDPVPSVFDGPAVGRVALLGPDYSGMKPRFEVNTGDRVKLGQVLFTDKKCPAIRFTSPGSGTVQAIHRGEKRRFESIVIDLEGDDEIHFKPIHADSLASLDPAVIINQMVESGLWTAFRSRPFGHVPDPDHMPHALFITAMDTHPLAPHIDKILAGQEADFQNGLILLSRLTRGPVYICQAPETDIPSIPDNRVQSVAFSGPHPAGLPSTHIHFLDPADRNRTVWHIGLQDVIAAGRLFTTGHIHTERIISIAGSMVKNPRMIRTRLGASVADLLNGELKAGGHRAISGSVLSGHHAESESGFLGRYHQQLSVIPEDTRRHLFGWLSPGRDLFSIKNIVLSGLNPKKRFDFTTNLHGGKRTIVPSGGYEKVMPLDILPTYLLRALAVDDIDEAEKLGCLELIEEDLALCTFVCPSKIDHMANLRRNLNLIEKEV